ncbi:general transcription factor 3C polypeptide 1 [Drosophila grimshawi]|uniref:GH10629 n=1 Tax=Drosophila grimshawi TaxID=7222 RepID=B4JCU7_DROGR|nr:general transcription factor 3C polypeptide 1 [Drosophila grimshawi]EDW03186.1 GH10629 [Drosophila grimshawi]
MCSAYSGGSWISAVLDEIALEGLEGTTLPNLWSLLADRLQCGQPLSETLQQQVWTLLLRSTDKVKFYELPEARPLMPPYNRINDEDPELGIPVVPETCPFLRLPYAPVKDGPIMGNCSDYKKRKPIHVKMLREMSVAEAIERWNQTLVVVASQDERLKALKPPNLLKPRELSVQQYIFWECIGRSRYNGETTRGPWSMTNYFKDSCFLFYTKNKFMKMNIVFSQPYTERHNGRTLLSLLVMLPRFHRIYKSHVQRVIERVYVEVKASPEQYVPTNDVQQRVKGLTSSRLKKLILSHNFRKFFETSLVHPSPPAGSGTSKDQQKGRRISVIRLRNSDTKFDELTQVNANDDKDDKQPSDDFLNHRHAHISMPIELESLRAIKRFGERGMSTVELSQYTCINVQLARGVIKHLLARKKIYKYTDTVGKTRIIRHVAIGLPTAATDGDPKSEQGEKIEQKLQCKEELNFPPNIDIVVNDLPNIKSNVRHMTFPKKMGSNPENETRRQLERKKIIVQQIDKTCIVHTTDVVRAIAQLELNIGWRGKICRKSMFRLLQRMQQVHVVNAYEVTLEYEHLVRIYRLVTHPKIDIEHEQLQREVLRLKSNFRLLSEERLLRPSQLRETERREVLARKKLRADRLLHSSALKTKPTAPKLLLACTLHEFLFYLLREQTAQQQPLEMNVELLQHWQRSEPSLLTRQFLDEWQASESQVLPYTQEISWRTFIPPLPQYADKPAGWLYFIDALERMPLSLMMRLFRVERDVADQLRPQLQHPVRQHYLLGQLQLQNLIPRLNLQQRYLNTLRLLNNMGLLQVSERQLGRDALQRWIYLNRRSCLLDTTTSSGHNFKCISPERSYERLHFEFESREQVDDYWAKLQNICIYTKLGFLKHRERKVGSRKDQRLPLLTFVRTVDFDEALALDDGSVPGDQQGAAGLSSSLYAHQFRHWSWVKRSSVAATRTTASNARQSTAQFPVRKRLSLMRLKTVPRFSKTRNPNSSGDTRKRKGGPRDDIDRDALRNMRTLRVTWCAAEDRLLKMGRAVYLFIDAPLPALSLYNVGTICRDVIRQYLGINNKTTQACVRRLQFLIRMKRDQPDVRNWIYMMQAQPEFNDIYNERFLPQLKREYPVRSDQIEALLIHFLLILNKLHRMIINEENVYRQFLLPDNLEDYRRRFREFTPLNVEQDTLLYANPSSETDLQITVVFGVLHSILCCNKDKTLFNLQAFEIYKHFSEDVLNAAFNKARADSLLVAVRRRNIHHVNRQVSGPGHLLSSKYKYRLVFQKYSYLLFDAYFALGQRFKDPKVGASLQLASPNFAQLLLLAERVAKRRLSLTLQLPANILTVDTTSMSRQSGSSSDRILDHYSSIFDNAPQTEYAKRLESVCSGRQAARVRFHPANLTYRVPCSAYNLLNKLPLRCMHLFCALDALGQSVNISCARLEHGECPFGCIMRSGNYVNAVERIVYEHRATLRQLVADALPQSPLQLQLDSSTSSSTTLIVSTANLLSLIHKLETYWRQQQQPHEQKDLGKALADSTLHKTTDWRTLCNRLLDFEAGKEDTERTQDYEPSLNKEERARAQDVFVVHLPTISMQQTEHQPLQAKQEELHKAVLDMVAKATYWRYTDNTFESLLPTLEQERNYDASAIQHVKDILEYIHERPLGAESVELRRTFPFGNFLLEALHELEAHDLIKRVGVASHMYVHREHMRHWVVHTFHIKRLERERVQSLVAASPSTLPAVVGQKRKLAELQEQEQVQVEQEQEQAEEQPSTSKEAKLSQQESNSNDDEELMPQPSARHSKRIKRISAAAKQEAAAVVPPAIESDTARDVIVMRPQPWIRVNASLNRRVLDRWMGAVLSECITRHGCTVYSLFLRFPHLLPVDTMLLLELLCQLDCIHLMELQPPKLHLECFGDEEEFREQQVTVLYDPNFTYVKVHADAIENFTNFVGVKKYNSEFI